MKKRIFAILTVILLLLTATACDSEDTPAVTDNDPVSTPAKDTPAEPQEEHEAAEGTEVLCDYEYYAVLKDGELWMFGEDTFKQTGVTGSRSAVPHLAVNATDIISVKTNAYVTAALTSKGELWTLGNNEQGQLGNGSNSSYKAQKVLEGVKDYFLANRETVALTENGDLYAWGSAHGNKPVMILRGITTVTSSSHNGGCFAAVTENGELYYWGFGHQNVPSFKERLETVTTASNGLGIKYIRPFKVADRVSKVYLNDENDGFAYITEDKELYACGIYKAEPKKILENVKDVDMSNAETDCYLLAQTEDNALYVWGYMFIDRSAPSFVGGSGYSHDTPPVKVMEGVKEFDAASKCAYIITEDGSLYAWGDNTNGQCGIEGTKAVQTPTKILDNVISVTSSKHTSSQKSYAMGGAITESGELYTWGYGGRSKCGQGGKHGDAGRTFTPAKILDGVTHVELGTVNSDCAAAVTENGVYVWGSFTSKVYVNAPDSGATTPILCSELS